MNKRKPGQCSYCRKPIPLSNQFCGEDHERKYRAKRSAESHKTYNAVRKTEPNRQPARFTRLILAWIYAKPHSMAER